MMSRHKENLKGEKMINCIVEFISIFSIIVSIILDITIQKNIITPCIVVLDDYIGIVFGGLCTVAALGNAIQSIIISAHSNKILGFTVKDLLNFDACDYDFRKIAVFSLGPVVVAIILLAMKACNTITAVAIILVIFMIKSSQQIWSLISNEKDATEIIKKEIELKLKGDLNPDFFLNIWFPELQNAIERNDVNLQDTYIGLIRKIVVKCSEANKDISVLLGTYLSNIFAVAVKHLGFVVAYRKILCLDAPREKVGADLNSIIHEYIGQIQFCPESNLYTYKIANTIEDILNRLDEDTDIRGRYVLYLYQAVVANTIISDRVRYDLINSIAKKLCDFNNKRCRDFGMDTIDEKCGELQTNIILQIAKRSIFENENVSERNIIHGIFVRNLYKCNRFSGGQCYYATIAQLFRAIYFYSNYETETLEKNYREKLAALYKYYDTGKERAKINLALLVEEKIYKVVKWLTDDATIRYHHEVTFDYFPEYPFAKRAVWSQENLIRFAFLVYAVYGYELQLFPVREMVEDKSVSVHIRKYMCTIITGFFANEKLMNDDVMAEINQMQRFLGTKQILPKVMFERNFLYFNERLREILKHEAAVIQSMTSNKVEDFTEYLQAQFEDLDPFVLNKSLPLENGQTFHMEPDFLRREERDGEEAIRRQLDYIKYILNLMLRQILPEKAIQYDLTGVNDLLDTLRSGQYKFTNYEYTKDYGIVEATRQTDEFRELEEIFSKFTIKSTGSVQSHVILKKEKIEFNANVEYCQIAPTELQCQDYLERFKIAEGKYRIENAVFDYAEAINYVKTRYVVVSSSICVTTNLTENSGFRIVYRPKNK